MENSKNEARNPDFAGHDAKPVERVVERVREWEHGEVLDGRYCGRKNRPIFTKPGELPAPCGQTKKGIDAHGCGGGDWQSKGIVLRDGKKNIIHREKA